MDINLKLSLLKADLQMLTKVNDEYLSYLIKFAGKEMEREGIKVVSDDLECEMVQIHYAAYLFRKRASPDATMPRFLRYELNNLLLGQKGKANDV